MDTHLDNVALTKRINELEAQVIHLAKELERYDDDHQQFVEDCKPAPEITEDPLSSVFKLQFDAILVAPMNTVIRMGIPHQICKRNGPMTAKELSSATGFNLELIVRLMRPLTSVEMFSEPAPETYGPTPKTFALASDNLACGSVFMLDISQSVVVEHELLTVYRSEILSKVLAGIPGFVLDPATSNSTGEGLFQQSLHTDAGFFNYLAARPKVHSAFNEFMAHHRFWRPNWYDCFTTDEVFGDGASNDPSAPLFVDIAGGNGQEGVAIREKSPNLSGKYYLQDLPETIDGNKNANPSVTSMKHDMFKPQPIKGSRVYYLRSILHDWPEEACVQILRNIAPALKEGYSKILIAEYVVPETGAPTDVACADIMMMILLEGAERTKSQWQRLVEKAGLRVAKIWEFGRCEGLIEVV